MQAAGELAKLLEPRRELVDRDIEQRRALAVGVTPHPADGQQHRREALLRPVVEVALDPTALGVGDLDETCAGRLELRLVALAVGDVAEVPRERRRAGQAYPRDRELDREL